MFRDGPDVSFNGSPIVSPITAALWASDPLGPSSLAAFDAPACNNQQPTNQLKVAKYGEHKRVKDIASKMMYLYVFLGIVPSTASVGS